MSESVHFGIFTRGSTKSVKFIPIVDNTLRMRACHGAVL